MLIRPSSITSIAIDLTEALVQQLKYLEENQVNLERTRQEEIAHEIQNHIELVDGLLRREFASGAMEASVGGFLYIKLRRSLYFMKRDSTSCETLPLSDLLGCAIDLLYILRIKEAGGDDPNFFKHFSKRLVRPGVRGLTFGMHPT